MDLLELSADDSALAEDEGAAARIQAKNGLESYSYNLCNSLNDSQLADMFGAADKTKLESSVNEAISWLDNSQEASKEEYEEKQKELEGIADPIMQQLCGAAGGAGCPESVHLYVARLVLSDI